MNDIEISSIIERTKNFLISKSYSDIREKDEELVKIPNPKRLHLIIVRKPTSKYTIAVVEFKNGETGFHTYEWANNHYPELVKAFRESFYYSACIRIGRKNANMLLDCL